MLSIHFPLEKDSATQLRQPATQGLAGEAAAAAEMVKSAIVDRESSFEAAHEGDPDEFARRRAHMREMALRARAYAQQISPDDERLSGAQNA